MLRDVATAALFGLSAGGVMDAFVVAFRIPNMFRRLFGEGALGVSYLPVLARCLERDRQQAWTLASVTLTLLAMLLVAVLLAAELVCGGLLWLTGDAPRTTLVLGLSATMLPYMVFICLAAQLAATLHALGHFTTPALAPILLNVCWLAGVLLLAPQFEPDKIRQAYALAACIVVAGLLQLVVQLPPLLRAGFGYRFRLVEVREPLAEVVRAMVPMMFGLAVTQFNTLADVLLAWGLSAAPGADRTIWWLGGRIEYPLEQGAAAALYYGERLYQFPLGLLGVAVATVIYPLLSRHAARGDHKRLGADLTLGLRLIALLGVPASAGLVLMAGPLASLLFQRGDFTPEDAARTAQVIACYGLGVWAFCALPVLVRGYYALEDRAMPVRLGAAMLALNVTLNLALVWKLGESALALTTSLSSALQVVLLAAIFSRRASPLAWQQLGRSMVAAVAGTALMSLVCFALRELLPAGETFSSRLTTVAVPVAGAAAVYFLVLRLISARDAALLLGRVREID